MLLSLPFSTSSAKAFHIFIIMIRSIPKFLQKGFLFNQRTFYPFCEKIDALKTYLEIIPPHKIYELREKKYHRLENALIKLENQETMDG